MVVAIWFNGTPLVGDRVQAGTGRRLLQRQPVEVGRVERVNGRPPVGALADVRGVPVPAGVRDDDGDEAVVVQGAVYGGREPDDRRTHAAVAAPATALTRSSPLRCRTGSTRSSPSRYAASGPAIRAAIPAKMPWFASARIRATISSSVVYPGQFQPGPDQLVQRHIDQVRRVVLGP
jgi:hypothetical protein